MADVIENVQPQEQVNLVTTLAGVINERRQAKIMDPNFSYNFQVTSD
jgi:hypothetical protein